SGPWRGGIRTHQATPTIAATARISASGRGIARRRRITRNGLAVAAAEPEYRQEERREEDLEADDHERRRQHRKALFGQDPEAAADPLGGDVARHDQTADEDHPA